MQNKKIKQNHIISQ